MNTKARVILSYTSTLLELLLVKAKVWKPFDNPRIKRLSNQDRLKELSGSIKILKTIYIIQRHKATITIILMLEMSKRINEFPLEVMCK